ncbi:MAG TPA: hypothetical protein VHD57_05265 [Vicinamibacterales bacterium]|jgi:hypothetical protein|nr:hypothetical protein [Vicinamibacterales bacterium]
MTQAVERLVVEFDALPEAEREMALAELLRRVAADRHDLPSGEDLTAAADHLFRELDRCEYQA